MYSVVIHSPHDLRVDQIDQPGAPEPGTITVQIDKGGICGSDLHYYHNGGFGTVKIREPMVLGHEVAGTIIAVGQNVTGLAVNDRVAVNPSMPCNQCQYCRANMRNQCTDMRFFGSAMRFPHQQGLFRQQINLPAEQLVKLSPDINMEHAACSEPLAVCLHAVRQAGALSGKKVLVSGCGPIGCLTILAAAHSGAHWITATDLSKAALDVASQAGANSCIDVARNADAFKTLGMNKGTQDVVFECSGSPQALANAFDAVKPGGTIITVGLGGNGELPLSLAVTKEVRMIGSFRFDAEFAQAAELIDRKVIDVSPIISSVLPFRDAKTAFDLASDRNQSMKVQLDFG
ncbi:L-idonate 5-dehydrogenase [Thalassospira sp. A3_1]|uniref:L-idonate 5-dehydrogenase n=1 Tax=Thalassospira sp. A3_1 TaxID=2821088 RepID=UPI001ADC2E97|nr:L-idonate 5-dehydrogenase [Thalassospira sp. A3_1]MBO9506072.1 L-idonate 5-dehydrogenase [Thalassospira sp. A3_1]